MFSKVINTGLTFSKILSGFSKTINIAGEVVPLYENIKPLFKNVNKIVNYFQKSQKNITNNNTFKNTTIKHSSVINNPTFFK